MEEDARVGPGGRHDVGLELEVLEVVVVHRADVEQVRAGAMHHNLAVFYFDECFHISWASQAVSFHLNSKRTTVCAVCPGLVRGSANRTGASTS